MILMHYVVHVLPRHTPDTCDYPVCNDDPVLCPESMVCEPVDKVILDQLELACLCIFVFDYSCRILTCAFTPGRLVLILLCENVVLILNLLTRLSVDHLFFCIAFIVHSSHVSILIPSCRLLSIMPHNWDQVNNVTGELEDPEYAPHHKLLLYSIKWMNLVDLLAIITGILAYLSTNETGNGNGLAIARVLRLVRVFRVFKVAGISKGQALFIGTLKRSMSAVRVMFFFSILAVIVIGTIMYYVEAGNFEVTEAHPEGVYMRWDYVRSEKEVSPYGSILSSMYWAVVTTTTVGYGDFYPTTGFGRFLACVYMYFGIIMLALPISVVGTNFQREYEIHYPDYIEKELKRQKQRAALGLAPPVGQEGEGDDVVSRDSVDMELVRLTASNVGSTSEDMGSKMRSGGRVSAREESLSSKVAQMDAKLEFLISEIRGLKSELILARGGDDKAMRDAGAEGSGGGDDGHRNGPKSY